MVLSVFIDQMVLAVSDSVSIFIIQIIGGAVLHDGAIAEMKTGEGKTLVSTLAAYLNALSGAGVHGILFLCFLLSMFCQHKQMLANVCSV